MISNRSKQNSSPIGYLCNYPVLKAEDLTSLAKVQADFNMYKDSFLKQIETARIAYDFKVVEFNTRCINDSYMCVPKHKI